jgi:hypothetical protein
MVNAGLTEIALHGSVCFQSQLVDVLSFFGANAGMADQIWSEPGFKKSFWFRRFIGY